ncbi:MAG: hypothetical protein ACE5FO_01500 [Parvularculaceae bacterium]
MKKSVLFIRPVWVVLIYLALFFLSGLNNVFDSPQFFLLGILAVLPAVIFQMFWALSLRSYFVARIEQNEISKSTPSQLVFYAGVVGYFFMGFALVSGAFGLIRNADQALMLTLALGMITGNLSAFILIGIAAYTLEKAEKGLRARTLNIIGSFLLIFYFPLGIWFIHPRLKRLCSVSA